MNESDDLMEIRKELARAANTFFAAVNAELAEAKVIPLRDKMFDMERALIKALGDAGD